MVKTQLMSDHPWLCTVSYETVIHKLASYAFPKPSQLILKPYNFMQQSYWRAL